MPCPANKAKSVHIVCHSARACLFHFLFSLRRYGHGEGFKKSKSITPILLEQMSYLFVFQQIVSYQFDIIKATLVVLSYGKGQGKKAFFSQVKYYNTVSVYYNIIIYVIQFIRIKCCSSTVYKIVRFFSQHLVAYQSPSPR